jgi:hypothetical protein
MTDIENIDKQKLIDVIKNADNYSISSFSLKILLGQLKVRMEVDESKEVENNCAEKLLLYIREYKNLPNVKKDLKTLFNIDLE